MLILRVCVRQNHPRIIWEELLLNLKALGKAGTHKENNLKQSLKELP